MELEKIKKALAYYSKFHTIYDYPEDWDSFKQGGPPGVDDMERYDDFNEYALEALKELEKCPS